MSYVYLARETATNDTVAIKVLSPKLSNEKSSVERLRREAGLAMRLEHPNVCRILRLGETEDGLIYLVMPYLQGELMSEREIRGGPFTLEQGMPLLIQMCRGLHHAHELHIIHRDLKPENVMLIEDAEAQGAMRAVVMDFGLAKERRAEPEVAKLTATGIVLGTPEFMSPEQIRGKTLDGRSDVYALGILAFEMFTGTLPFQGRSAQEMMIARLRGNATPLRQAKPDLPAKLEQVIAKSLETDPEKRWASMHAFAEALSSVGGATLFGKLFRK
jgi:serine/threonine-protein kinase